MSNSQCQQSKTPGEPKLQKAKKLLTTKELAQPSQSQHHTDQDGLLEENEEAGRRSVGRGKAAGAVQEMINGRGINKTMDKVKKQSSDTEMLEETHSLRVPLNQAGSKSVTISPMVQKIKTRTNGKSGSPDSLAAQSFSTQLSFVGPRSTQQSSDKLPLAAQKTLPSPAKQLLNSRPPKRDAKAAAKSPGLVLIEALANPADPVSGHQAQLPQASTNDVGSSDGHRSDDSPKSGNEQQPQPFKRPSLTRKASKASNVAIKAPIQPIETYDLAKSNNEQKRIQREMLSELTSQRYFGSKKEEAASASAKADNSQKKRNSSIDSSSRTIKQRTPPRDQGKSLRNKELGVYYSLLFPAIYQGITDLYTSKQMAYNLINIEQVQWPEAEERDNPVSVCLVVDSEISAEEGADNSSMISVEDLQGQVEEAEVIKQVRVMLGPADNQHQKPPTPSKQRKGSINSQLTNNSNLPKKNGRWTKEEHFRFLAALKLYGKEWRNVQKHVGTRSSTQARSHAQKFFLKLEKKNMELEQFLKKLDLTTLRENLKEIDSDYDDDDEGNDAQIIKNLAKPFSATQGAQRHQEETKLISKVEEVQTVKNILKAPTATRQEQIGRTRSKTSHAIFETEVIRPQKMTAPVIAEPSSTSVQEATIITQGIQPATHVASRLTGLKRATSDTGNVVFEEEARGSMADLMGASNDLTDGQVPKRFNTFHQKRFKFEEPQAAAGRDLQDRPDCALQPIPENATTMIIHPTQNYRDFNAPNLNNDIMAAVNKNYPFIDLNFTNNQSTFQYPQTTTYAMQPAEHSLQLAAQAMPNLMRFGTGNAPQPQTQVEHNVFPQEIQIQQPNKVVYAPQPFIPMTPQVKPIHAPLLSYPMQQIGNQILGLQQQPMSMTHQRSYSYSMAVQGDGGSSAQNNEFGPSYKGGLSALDDDEEVNHCKRSRFEDSDFMSQQSPIKTQMPAKDAFLFERPPSHAARNDLTAAFTSLEGNQFAPPANINMVQPALVSILSHALKPDGQQWQASAEPGHRGLTLSGQNNCNDNNNWIEGDSGVMLRNEQATRMRHRTNSLEYEQLQNIRTSFDQPIPVLESRINSAAANMPPPTPPLRATGNSPYKKIDRR